MFHNRTDAARRLAERLKTHAGAEAVILGLPRGGVVLGAEVARLLSLPFDIIVTRKVGAPDNPEYALCAVDEKGDTLCDDAAADFERDWLVTEMAREREEAARRLALYRGTRRAIPLRGKTAVIVDDGIATGLTMRLAVIKARKEGAARIIAAVPIAPPEAVALLQKEADEVVVLEHPRMFRGAVSAHYAHFPEVRDAEVLKLMHGAPAL